MAEMSYPLLDKPDGSSVEVVVDWGDHLLGEGVDAAQEVLGPQTAKQG